MPMHKERKNGHTKPHHSNVKHLKSMSKTNSHVPPPFQAMPFSCKLIFIFFKKHSLRVLPSPPNVRISEWIYYVLSYFLFELFRMWLLLLLAVQLRNWIVAVGDSILSLTKPHNISTSEREDVDGKWDDSSRSIIDRLLGSTCIRLHSLKMLMVVIVASMVPKKNLIFEWHGLAFIVWLAAEKQRQIHWLVPAFSNSGNKKWADNPSSQTLSAWVTSVEKEINDIFFSGITQSDEPIMAMRDSETKKNIIGRSVVLDSLVINSA